MRSHAIAIDGYGPPEVLRWRELDLPPVPDAELRIRTIAAAVNRADVEIRSGAWPVQRRDPFPYTPGLEVVGDVERVGAGVEGIRPGDRVITMMQRLGGIWGERPGGYAEHVTVRADAVAVLPPEADALEVAALGLAAVTAAAGLERLELRPGDRVVVLGASGGVGSAAVALARAQGAEVVGVLPSAAKADHVRELGASEVVSLDDARLLDALGPRSVDAVLEVLGGRTFPDSVAVLARGGRLCLVGALTGPDLRLSAWDLLQDLVLTGWSSENLTGVGLRAAMPAILASLRSGTLRSPVYERFALPDAAEAHRRMEAGELTGRALLLP